MSFGRPRGRRPWLVAGALLVLAAVPAASFVDALLVRLHAEPRVVTTRGVLAADERSTVDIFEQVSPSVVYLTTTGRAVHPRARGVVEVPRGTGSGFVWDAHGHVVTNYHVIAGARGAEVRLADGRSFRAELVGASRAHDLAVLRIRVPFGGPIDALPVSHADVVGRAPSRRGAAGPDEAAGDGGPGTGGASARGRSGA